MRAWVFITLTATSFLLLPPTRAWAASSKAQTTERFDTAANMRSMLGNYDPSTRTSSSTVPHDNQGILKGSSFEPGDEILVRSFWKSEFRQDGVNKVVLLTYAVPSDSNWKPLVPKDRPFSCHACAPLIGMALFTWSGTQWKIEGFRINVSRLGAWGQPPSDVRLLKIGPHRTAVQITSFYEGQGVTTESKQIFASSGQTISEVLNVLIAENNKGGCERHRPSNEPRCYQYRKSVIFNRRADADYYDMTFTLRGTDYSDENYPQVHQVSGVEKFRFIDGRYKKVLSRGSMTSTEKAIHSDEEAQQADH